jgi:hypothetical protein
MTTAQRPQAANSCVYSRERPGISIITPNPALAGSTLAGPLPALMARAPLAPGQEQRGVNPPTMQLF